MYTRNKALHIYIHARLLFIYEHRFRNEERAFSSRVNTRGRRVDSSQFATQIRRRLLSVYFRSVVNGKIWSKGEGNLFIRVPARVLAAKLRCHSASFPPPSSILPLERKKPWKRGTMRREETILTRFLDGIAPYVHYSPDVSLYERAMENVDGVSLQSVERVWNTGWNFGDLVVGMRTFSRRGEQEESEAVEINGENTTISSNPRARRRRREDSR